MKRFMFKQYEVTFNVTFVFRFVKMEEELLLTFDFWLLTSHRSREFGKTPFNFALIFYFVQRLNETHHRLPYSFMASGFVLFFPSCLLQGNWAHANCHVAMSYRNEKCALLY